MPIRSALTRSQKDAIQTPAAAKVLVESLNKETSILRQERDTLRANLVDVQNRFEGLRAKFNRADKNNSVLASKLDFYVLIEVLKFLASGGVTAFGFTVYPDNKLLGGVTVFIGINIYIGLTSFEHKSIAKALTSRRKKN